MWLGVSLGFHFVHAPDVMNEHPSFAFATVPQLISEPGSSAQIGKHVAARLPRARRALIVTDPGFLRTGLVEAPRASLEQNGMTVAVFSDVVADPPEAVVLKAVEFARAHGTDVVIGLGGGSSMDVAKLIAVLAGSDQPIAEAYGIGNVKGERLPLVQVPTTAGTGSEVTNIAIVTTGETSKMGVVAPQLYADIALLDARLTLGLPPAVTAATGIDAMVHAIEAFTSRHKKNPISDILARQALRLLSQNLAPACQQGSDLKARQAMLLGACLAGQAFSNAPVAAVHALAFRSAAYSMSRMACRIPSSCRMSCASISRTRQLSMPSWRTSLRPERTAATNPGQKPSLLQCSK